MAHLNVVHLIGRLTRAPEQKIVGQSTRLAEFGLATTKKYKDAQGNPKEDTLFIDCTAWGNVADIAQRFLTKGKLVYLGGRLKFDQWNDRDTGKTRSKISLVVETLQILEWDNEQKNAVQHARDTLSPPAGVMAGMPNNNKGWKPQQNWEQPPMDEPPF